MPPATTITTALRTNTPEHLPTINPALTGTEVASGAIITVRLGEAPEAQTVPDVVGSAMNEQQARGAVEAAGVVFVKGPDVAIRPRDLKAGLAASQSPAAGEIVAPDNEVTVSFYETSSTVPDLAGLSPSAAEETLEAAGLLMFEGEICAPSAAQNIGRIARQGIAPGTEVAPGSSVTVRRGQLTATACPPPPS